MMREFNQEREPCVNFMRVLGAAPAPIWICIRASTFLDNLVSTRS